MSSKPQDDDVALRALGALPAPPLPPALSARTLRRAHAELPMPGEGTLSLCALGLFWDRRAVPITMLAAGGTYTVLALIKIVEIFG